MPNVFRALAAVTVGAALIGSATHGVAATADGKDVVVTVNGQPITVQDVNIYTQQRSGGKPVPATQRPAIVNEMITRELLYQEAVKQGLDKDPQVESAVRQQTHTMLADVAIQGLLQSKQPTDAELRAAYKSRVKDMGGKEYHARHILVKSQKEAEAIIAQLNKGADFAKLANKDTQDPSGKGNGGDLGWFSPHEMVKPFSDATKALKPGSYTKTPVKTQFGWHVIELEGTRDAPPPSFDDMKPQLLNAWRSQMIQAYLGQLRGHAKVKVVDDSIAGKIQK